MSEREPFSFGGSGFSATESKAVDISSFLDEDPNTVTKTKVEVKEQNQTKTPEEIAEEEKKKKEQEEANKNKPKALPAESLYDDEDHEEEDNEEEEDKTPDILKAKKEEKKAPEVTETTPYEDLYKDLRQLGVFTADEDEEGNEIEPEIKSDQDFLKAFQSEVTKQMGSSIEKFLERFGPEYSDMFQAVYVNGVPPNEYIARQSRIDNIQDFDISTEENQEKIVRQWYKLENRSQESIDAKILKLKNYADLEDEAKEAQKVLVAREQTNLQNLAAQKRQELINKQAIKQEYTKNVSKILQERAKAKEFDGIPVDKKFAEQIYSYLTKDAYETKDKTPLTEFDKDILDLNRPENHSNKVKIAMLLQIIKQDPTLSRLGKKAVSKETNKLFNSMEQKFGKKAPSTTSTKKEEEATYNW